jgi:cytoskeletal protein CcmA (bactofilin family)
MWGEKKQETPTRTPPIPQQQPREHQTPAPSFTGEAKNMAPLDSAYPSSDRTSSGGQARLGASLHVKGEITGNEDLAIDGTVEGLVQLEDRRLTVGASAKVTADVIAREVVVYGNVKGNLRARDRIEIKKDGSVVGDLTTARIMIEDGAYFKGSIEIDKAGEASSSDNDLDKPTFSRVSRGAATSA